MELLCRSLPRPVRDQSVPLRVYRYECTATPPAILLKQQAPPAKQTLRMQAHLALVALKSMRLATLYPGALGKRHAAACTCARQPSAAPARQLCALWMW
jgi:hypothetical protein